MRKMPQCDTNKRVVKMDLSKLYKIPWTKYDNPNGWIEVTTYCELECPGCYRGMHLPGVKREHAGIDQLKREIDELIEIRNIQTVSISGGEPLLFPHLDEVISYAKERGIKSRVYTNGIALTKEKLRQLKDAGLTEAVIHLSLWQNRDKSKNEQGLMPLRIGYCDMFRKVSGVNLGFIMPVLKSNFNEFESVLRFYKENSDIISMCVFIVYRDILNGLEGEYVPLKDINREIMRIYGTKPCAYLPKLHNQDEPSWLFNFPVFLEGKVIGAFDNNCYRTFQEGYKRRTGRYQFTASGALKRRTLLYALRSKPIRRILVDNLFKKGELRYQLIAIVDTPDILEDGRIDLCDSCPDAMLYKGEMVPKCCLEWIKKGYKVTVVR